jgi:preprotein translocase subunit SecA
VSSQASASFRPGIARGPYPERREERDGWLDRALHGLRGAIARRRQADRATLEELVRSVERLGADLRREKDAKIGARVQDLRQRLVIEGLSEDLLQRCFAIVREMARRTLGMEHFDVQLMGGWVMARGMLAEMETGEGKTLTATLPASAAALAGIPVHVISVNDYLVDRDAEAMRPLYEALGLSVGAVTEREKEVAARRAAYARDVTYGTSKQIAFDYLRDRLQARRPSGGAAPGLAGLDRKSLAEDHPLLRGLCFAIVDEADSVFIDEARTPLILAGAGGSPEQSATCRRALRLARALEEGHHFRLQRREGRVELTERGRERLGELTRPLKGIWTGPRRREEWVHLALSALHLFDRDRHYLVRDGRVEIIDQPTGRAAPDRSWQRGLHQLIEVKEGCAVTPERETLARISYQQFFRRYLRLAGMTGTAREVAPELWSVYGLQTRVIPTRLPLRRQARPIHVFRTEESKWRAVVERVRSARRRGRPVLVGTCSVRASEHVSRLLAAQDLPHRVLNARQDAEEASVVAEAGQPGRVTVATNMAGRGTDIRLAPGVAERGGLHVIAAQRADARRIDRQLFGRCGRQGDPGSFEALLSLEDEPVAIYYPAWIRRLLARLGAPGAPLGRWVGEALTRLPQRAEERRHAQMRRNLVDLEDDLDDLLAFSGPRE